MLLSESAPGIDAFFGGDGIDQVSVFDAFGSGLTRVAFNHLVLNAAASVEYFTLEDASIALTGTGGDDLIDLSGTTALTNFGSYVASIRFNLLDGNDSYYGGNSADDVIISGGGDQISLGAGDDTLTINDFTEVGDVLFGGAGMDVINFQVSAPDGRLVFQTLNLSVAAGFEGVRFETAIQYGTEGADVWDMSGITPAIVGPGGGSYSQGMELLGGNDLFSGSDGAESVSGGTGNDSLYGGASYDQLFGGTGNDALYGGTGDDYLHFDDWQAADLFYGGDGSDHLQIGRNDNPLGIVTIWANSAMSFTTAQSVEEVSFGLDIQITGTTGADLFDFRNLARIQLANTIQLLDGNDRYYGSSGDGNNVDGGAGDDWLYGGNGSDTLIGGSGNDSMVGGEGSDVYEINSSGDVIVETGRYGIDTLIVTARTWTLAAPFEGLKAEGKGGLIGIGNNKGNYLTGGAGDDSRSGLAGRDYMTGAGQDTLLGGTGSDIYYVTDHSVTIVELAKEGIDTIVTEAASWTLTGAVENLSLIGDADAVGIGSASGNVMVANGTGNETLQGMGGNDTLVGYRGGARLEGGTGNDTYSVGVLGGQIVELAHEGVDRVDVYFGIGVDPMTFPAINAYILPDFIEQLYLHPQLEMGSNDQDRPVTGTGNASNNRIVAGNGNDTLYGLDGNDTLLGGSDELGASSNDGNDSLIGGNGDDTYLLRFYAVAGSATVADTVVEAADGGFDTIEVIANYLSLIGYANVEALTNIYYSGGGAHKLGCVVEGNSLDNVLTTGIGEDRLNGGDGHDTLSGGAGNDQFRFSAAFGQSNFITESSDTITDFTHAADKIMLNSLTFSNLGFGPVANAAFKVISGGGVVDGSDRLLYNQTTGQLFYDRDGNGAGEAWLLAVFSNHTVLTASDFSAGFQGQDS